jgi:hypothetical protein
VCTLYSYVLWQQFLTISRAHTGTTQLGLNFSQVNSGWKTHVEDAFIAYLNNIFSASPFFYTLTSINGDPACKMCQAVALPNATLMQDHPSLCTMIRDQYNQFHINLDATESAGAPEMDDTGNDTLDINNLYKMLEDSSLYQFGGSNDEGSVNLTQLYP